MKNIVTTNRITTIFIIALSCAIFSLSPLALNAQDIEEGPSWEGRDYGSAIKLGYLTGNGALSDLRDTRKYYNSYGGKGNDIYYHFYLTDLTTLLIDKIGSESEGGYVWFLKYQHHDPYLTECYPDVYEAQMLFDEMGEILPVERYGEQYTEVWGFRNLEPGEYYMIVEGPYGNAGGWNGMQQVNMFYASPKYGKNLSQPIDLGVKHGGIYFRDIKDAVSYSPLDEDDEFPNEEGEVLYPEFEKEDNLPFVIYKFDTRRFMSLVIDNDYYKASPSDFYLFDEELRLYGNVSKTQNENGALTMRVDTLPPGVYYLVSKAASQQGTIVTQINSEYVAPLGTSLENPIYIGSYSKDFQYDRQYNYQWYLEPYYEEGVSTAYYKVDLLNNMNFEIQVEPTGYASRKISILDSNKNSLHTTGTDYSSGTSMSLKKDMQHGTYYIVVTTNNICYNPVTVHVIGRIDQDVHPKNALTLSYWDNYILTSKPLKAVAKTSELKQDEIVFTVNYFDGLGRTKQQIATNASPQGHDIVSFSIYDDMGRPDTKQFIAYITDGRGLLRASPVSEQQTFYQTKFEGDSDSNYSFTQKQYDSRGLVVSKTGVGKTANDHPTEFDYRLNIEDDAIRKYVIADDGSSLKFACYYGENLLQVKMTRQGNLDPEGSEVYQYTDAEGKIIAKEVRISNGERHITYYAYDDFGRQRYLIPPIQNEILDVMLDSPGAVYPMSDLRDYCYYTEYDKYGRAIKQYVPGAEPVVTIYDKRDRVVMTQSGNMRDPNNPALDRWSFVKYDVNDRPILSGTYTGGNYDEHLTAVEAQTTIGETRGDAAHGYTNNCYPVVQSQNDVLSITYYDDYEWISGSEYGFRADSVAGEVTSNRILGLTTGSKVKVLGIDQHLWLTSVSYYDSDYRVIQSVADLYPGGQEIVSNTHDFTGNVTKTRIVQQIGTQTYGYKKEFIIDSRGRLQRIDQQLFGDAANGKVTLAAYTYDELGNIVEKIVHNGADTTCYEYRLSGAGVGAQSNAFSYRLGFDRPADEGLASRPDGQLAGMVWGAGNTLDKGYDYAYDRYMQLTSATLTEKTNGTWVESPARAERGMSYDKNGNILSVERTDGQGQTMQSLAYNYDGNLLRSLDIGGATVPTQDFAYDAEGNMTYDGMSGIGISYNILNLPEKIFVGTDTITYIYTAAGERLASHFQTPSLSSLTYYRSVMVYASDGGGQEQLLYIHQPEGLIVPEEGSNGLTWTYKYFKTDHTGSTRALLAARDGMLEVEQTSDYYPFGLAWETNNLHLNRHLYSGKQIEDAVLNGSPLALYYFGARYYNPVLARWFNIDPALQLANPFLYCGNSPGMYIDPDGEFIHLIIGAVIGGIMNWAFNGAEFSWEGLGYFGIGALSGALGAGVGGGISSSMAVAGKAAGGFTAGFLGTSAATTATSSFVSGLAIGAGAGFSGGFTSGFGNALYNGKNFGQALAQGGLHGFIGGFSGGLIGGLVGGIDAVIDGRTFWNGTTVTKNTYSVPIAGVQQIGENNCLAADFEAIDQSFGGNLTQENIRQMAGGGNPATDPLDIGRTANAYTNKTGHSIDVIKGDNVSGQTYGAVGKGGRVVVNLKTDTTVGHAVTVRDATQKIITKINGKVKVNYFFKVMNPANGGFERLSNLNNSNAIFIIF